MKLVKTCSLTQAGAKKLQATINDNFLGLKEVVGRSAVSENTIRKIVNQKTVKYSTLVEVFSNLELQLEVNDIATKGDHNMDEKVLQDFARMESKGKVATIHSAELGQLPTPLLYGERQKTGIPSNLLDRVSLVCIRGSWRMPQKFRELQEFLGRLHQGGELRDVVTKGCAWVEIDESNAPSFDNQSGVIWVPIASPPEQPALDYVAWGGIEEGYKTWVRSTLPNGGVKVYATDPNVAYLTRTMRLIEINGKPYRYSEDVEKVA